MVRERERWCIVVYLGQISSSEKPGDGAVGGQGEGRRGSCGSWGGDTLVVYRGFISLISRTRGQDVVSLEGGGGADGNGGGERAGVLTERMGRETGRHEKMGGKWTTIGGNWGNVR